MCDYILLMQTLLDSKCLTPKVLEGNKMNDTRPALAYMLQKVNENKVIDFLIKIGMVVINLCLQLDMFQKSNKHSIFTSLFRLFLINNTVT